MVGPWTRTPRWLAAGLAIALLAALLAACGNGEASGDDAQNTGDAAGSTNEEQVAEAGPATEDDEQPDEAVEPAPALGTIDEWHNSEPLSLDQLEGQPVLLVFWADF